MPRLTRVLGLAAVAAFTSVLAACGGAAEEANPASVALFIAPVDQSLAIEMADVKFSVGAISAKSGEVVEITLANKGSIEHDFSIATLPGEKAFRVGGKDIALGHGGSEAHAHLKASAKGVLRLRASSPGTYEFFCSVTGHKGAGMKGTLAVQ